MNASESFILLDIARRKIVPLQLFFISSGKLKMSPYKLKCLTCSTVLLMLHRRTEQKTMRECLHHMTYFNDDTVSVSISKKKVNIILGIISI